MKKLNWINVVATLLIVAGVISLVRRVYAPAAVQSPPTTNPITTDEIRNRVLQNLESALGRPMNDIERQMVTIDRHGDVAQVTVVDPLKSRLADAQRQRAMKTKSAAGTSATTSATFPSTFVPSPPPQPSISAGSSTMTPMPASSPVPSN